MRKMVRKPIGMDEDDPDMTNDDVDDLLNRAFWEIQDKFPFREKERTGTFVTQAGIRNYEMPKPFEAIKHLSITDLVSGEHTPLDPTTDDWYELNYTDGVNAWGKPEKYLREDCFARLWPTPDKAYTLTLRRLIVLTDLSDTKQTTDIPQVWDEIIGYGGCWRAFIDLGDFARANQVKAHQVTLLNTVTPTEVKEKADYSRAGLEVLGREY